MLLLEFPSNINYFAEFKLRDLLRILLFEKSVVIYFKLYC